MSNERKSEQLTFDEVFEEMMNNDFPESDLEMNKEVEEELDREIDEMFSKADEKLDSFEEELNYQKVLNENELMENLVEEHLYHYMERYKTLDSSQVVEDLQTNYDKSKELELINENYEEKFEREMTAEEEGKFVDQFEKEVIDSLDYGKSAYVEEEFWEEVSLNINNEGINKTPKFYRENSDHLYWGDVALTNEIDTDIYFENEEFLSGYKEAILENPNVYDAYLMNHLEKESEQEREQEKGDDFSL